MLYIQILSYAHVHPPPTNKTCIQYTTQLHFSFSTQPTNHQGRLSPQQRPPHLGYIAHGHRDMISTQGGPRFHLSTTKGAQGQGEILLESRHAPAAVTLTYLSWGVFFLGWKKSNIHPIRLWGRFYWRFSWGKNMTIFFGWVVLGWVVLGCGRWWGFDFQTIMMHLDVSWGWGSGWGTGGHQKDGKNQSFFVKKKTL